MITDPAAVEDREYHRLAKGEHGAVRGRRFSRASPTHRNCKIS